MNQNIFEFSVRTTSHTQMIDITRQVQQTVSESGVKDGLCIVFIPHTTAAVTINENADPDVQTDFMKEINKIVPWEDGYLHMEGNAAAHLKASMMGFSETIIINEGRLVLGTWQGIYFLEYDGARNRKVIIKIMSD
ncbi:MAG: secondary thiamine-phosphate synthase enzyme YjbQ [Lachnospiraceae bacterium]|nr:secondary thiamine-phosphate synthase enzyme YjbQ [Lachnospiraceae bacterium]